MYGVQYCYKALWLDACFKHSGKILFSMERLQISNQHMDTISKSIAYQYMLITTRHQIIMGGIRLYLTVTYIRNIDNMATKRKASELITKNER